MTEKKESKDDELKKQHTPNEENKNNTILDKNKPDLENEKKPTKSVEEVIINPSQNKSSGVTKSQVDWQKNPFVVGIAVLVGLITIYSFVFQQSDAIIRVDAEIFDFEMPYPLIKEIEDYRNFKRIGEQTIKRKKERDVKEGKEFEEIYESFFDSDIKEVSFGSILYSPKNLKTFYSFRISNDGAKSAEGVKLHLPFNGYYRYSRNNKQFSGEFEQEIDIGEVRQLDTFIIYVWTSDSAIYREFEDMRITYPNGFAYVNYPVRAYGFWAGVVEYKAFFEGLFYTFIFFVIVMIVVSMIGWLIKKILLYWYE